MGKIASVQYERLKCCEYLSHPFSNSKSQRPLWNSHLSSPMPLHTLCPRFLFFFPSLLFLPLSSQPAVFPATHLTVDEGSEIREDCHNKSQSAEMKINDCLTQRSLKSEKKKKNVLNERRRKDEAELLRHIWPNVPKHSDIWN